MSNPLSNGAALDRIMEIMVSLGIVDSASTNLNNTNYQKALQAFVDNYIDLSILGAWQYENCKLFFSMQPIKQDKSTTMYFIPYRQDSKHFTVWTTTTRKIMPGKDAQVGNSGSYYVLGGPSEKPNNPNADTDQTFDKAMKVYYEMIRN